MIIRGHAYYHRVEDILWFVISSMLRELAVSAIQQPTRPLAAVVTPEQAMQIADFVEQMQFLYVHPRRESLVKWQIALQGRKSVCQSSKENKPKLKPKAK